MAKLYIADLIILDPKLISRFSERGKTPIKQLDSEYVLVKRTPFGYKEVFTKTKLKKVSAIKKSTNYDNDKFPFVVVSPLISQGLIDNEVQFLLDSEYSLPLKEAEESDTKECINKFFESSQLKKCCDEKQRKRNKEIEARRKLKESRKRAKTLVKKRIDDIKGK